MGCGSSKGNRPKTGPELKGKDENRIEEKDEDVEEKEDTNVIPEVADQRTTVLSETRRETIESNREMIEKNLKMDMLEDEIRADLLVTQQEWESLREERVSSY